MIYYRYKTEHHDIKLRMTKHPINNNLDTGYYVAVAGLNAHSKQWFKTYDHIQMNTWRYVTVLNTDRIFISIRPCNKPGSMIK